MQQDICFRQRDMLYGVLKKPTEVIMPKTSNAQTLPQTKNQILNIDKFKQTPLVNSSFSYTIVSDFINPEAAQGLLKAYPEIKKTGSFALDSLKYGPEFENLLEELRGDEFRQAVEQKFGLDLSGKPTIITVRGMSGLKDGNIHTDTKSKIISLLLYMNDEWGNDGGRLRLLRSNNIDDVITEISPAFGTLLVFKRADNSWHGHKLHEGKRKVVQLNWVVSQKSVDRNNARHRLSSWLKNLFGKNSSEY